MNNWITMKKLFVIGLIILSACSGNEQPKQEKGVTITGKVNNPLSGLITLELMDGGKIVIEDTIVLDKDNTFTHFIVNTEPLIYRINFYDAQAVNLIVDKDDIDVHVDGNNPKGFSRVEGSKDLEYLNEINDMVQGFQEKLAPMNQKFIQARNEGDVEKAEAIQLEIEEQRQLAVKNVKGKIREMGNSIAALFAANYVFSDDNYPFLDSLARKFKEERPNSVYTKEFVKRTDEMGKLAIGSLAPDFTLPNTKGEMVSLSSFRGTYLLVDFWAKWCRPCRMENPNIVKAYNRFHNDGFDILGVSLDRSKQDWEQAIAEDGLNWNHVSDLKYWGSEVVPLYNIKGIPFAVLLDPEGRIVAKNLRGAELHSKLEEVLLTDK